MRPIVIELKLDLKCLSKKERHALEMYFVEGKWLKNYLLSLSDKDFRSFDTRTRDIHSLDKDKNKVSRHLEMPAKLIQSVYQQIKHDMKALAAKRKKTGRKNGKRHSTSTSITTPIGYAMDLMEIRTAGIRIQSISQESSGRSAHSEWNRFLQTPSLPMQSSSGSRPASMSI